MANSTEIVPISNSTNTSVPISNNTTASVPTSSSTASVPITSSTAFVPTTSSTAFVPTSSKSTPITFVPINSSASSLSLMPDSSVTPTTTELEECESPVEFVPCSLNIFYPTEGVRRTWYVTFSRTKATYSCYDNHNQVSGDIHRYCDNTTGRWSGEEIECEPDEHYNKRMMVISIVSSVVTISIIVLILDFLLRLHRKTQLRIQKARLAKIARIFSTNQLESTRIRPYPSLKSDFVLRNTLEIDPNVDYMDYKDEGPMTVGAQAKGTDKKMPNLFTILHPKIRII